MWPTAVLGNLAVEMIINAIKGFNDDSYSEKPCVIIIARGGGSVEDLMIFNDEKLAITVFESKIPIVSATQTTRSGYSNTDVGLEDTSESFGLPATADLMFAIISTEQMEEVGQIMVKQLKNRYNDPTINRKFVVGIDRSKLKLFDVDQAAQDELVDNGQEDDTPSFDIATGGKFKKRDFEGFEYE